MVVQAKSDLRMYPGADYNGLSSELDLGTPYTSIFRFSEYVSSLTMVVEQFCSESLVNIVACLASSNRMSLRLSHGAQAHWFPGFYHLDRDLKADSQVKISPSSRHRGFPVPARKV